MRDKKHQMCSRASGFFCACLFFSCVVHHCRCTNKQDHHHHNIDNREEEQGDSNFLPDDKVDSYFFIHELFEIYGHNGLLNTKEFEIMLETLGIVVNRSYGFHHCHHSAVMQELKTQRDHVIDSHNNSAKTPETSVTDVPSDLYSKVELTTMGKSSEYATSTELSSIKDNSTTIKRSNDFEDASSEMLKNRCFTPHELLQTHNISMQEDLITPSDFYRLCPAIIYHIKHNVCVKELAHRNSEVDYDHEDSGLKIWLYASLSVLAISLCGLLSVAVIPLIQRLCYHTLLQFLVALAVGSLSGDALLHLLPHSMALSDGHHHEEGTVNGHSSTFIWRGFTALLGIYLFFIAERLLNHITSYRKVKQRTKALQMPKFARSLTNVDGEQSRVVGEKLSHHKHGSYGYKFDPAAVEGLERLSESVLEEKKLNADEKLVEHSESQDESLHVEVDETKASRYPDDASSKSVNSDAKDVEKNEESSSPLKPLHVDVTYLPPEKQREPETPTEECHRETVVYRHAHDDHSYVVTVTDHHHHHHGHSHELPNTISSVAWMVVMGDGLHNFCDGLAIGAAFGSGLPGGISTSVAVLLHELPHELGDFAMLLKAGMSVKQAMLYNSISSVLCFIGTLIGVSLGNIPSVTNWIFAGAAGMFMYIALVDMLPELAAISGHSNDSICRQLLVQFLGITTGTSVMLLIAIFEHDLQHLVS